MNTLPSISIKDLLVTAGYSFGGTADWAVYIGARPDNPDRSITIFDSGGRTPDPRWLLDYPAIQIIVKGKPEDYVAAWEQCNEIKKILLGLPSQDLNGDRWVHINMLGEIGYLGKNRNEEPEFALNLTLIIEPADDSSNRDPI